MVYNEEEVARIRTVLDYHVGKGRDDKPVSEQIRILQYRKRRFIFITAINVLALVFFAYWFISGLTELASWIFYILIAVFLLNLLSISYQKRQIEQAISWLQTGTDVNRL